MSAIRLPIMLRPAPGPMYAYADGGTIKTAKKKPVTAIAAGYRIGYGRRGRFGIEGAILETIRKKLKRRFISTTPALPLPPASIKGTILPNVRQKPAPTSEKLMYVRVSPE